MADGEVEGYGVAVVADHVGDHRLHVGVVGVGFVAGEVADNQSGEAVEDAHEFQLVQHSLNFIDRLGDVFDKEYGSGLENVVGRSDKCLKYCEVSADKAAFGCALAVERTGLDIVGGDAAFEDVEQGGRVRGMMVGMAGDIAGHRSVDGGDTVARHEGVEGRNIAESYEPFCVVAKREAVERIKQLNRAVTPAYADDGFNRRVHQCVAKVREPLLDRSAVCPVAAAGVGGDLNVPAMTAQYFDRALDILQFPDTGRRDQADRVAGFQGRGDDQRLGGGS